MHECTFAYMYTCGTIVSLRILCMYYGLIQHAFLFRVLREECHQPRLSCFTYHGQEEKMVFIGTNSVTDD